MLTHTTLEAMCHKCGCGCDDNCKGDCKCSKKECESCGHCKSCGHDE